MSTILMFPPIVTTGFGAYYPSLPVLAGHLQSQGLEVKQFDLNQELARKLLSCEMLRVVGTGFLPGKPGRPDPTNMAAIAARLLEKNRSRILATDERLASIEGATSDGYLLPLTCKTLLVDESVEQLFERLDSTCSVCDWYRNFFEEASIGPALSEEHLKVVGISVPMGPQLLPALLLAKHVKQIRPDVRVVMGGATLSLMSERDLDHLLKQAPYVDAVVRYEGECALLALVLQAETGQWSTHSISNVSSLKDDGTVQHCVPHSSTKLDKLAFSDYSGDILRGLQDPELGIVQTRGCYWGRCAYCDFVELYEGSPRYRTRSPEGFVSEVEHQIRVSGVSRFSLITEAIPPSFARRFAELVLEKGLVIRWNSFAMVDRHFTDEHFWLMKSSGCERLVIGLETMTDRVLRLVGKYATAKDNKEFLCAAKSAGIQLNVNLIPNLPSTTYREALQSLEAMRELADVVDTVTVFPFEATRSSQIGRNPGKYGLIPILTPQSSGQALFAANHLAVHDRGMTSGEVEEVVARYQQFADWINARKFVKADSLKLSDCSDTSFRIAHEDIDVISEGDEILIFNCRTREHWRAPNFVLSLIDGISTRRSPVTASALRETLKKYPEVGAYLQRLLDTRVLVSVHG